MAPPNAAGGYPSSPSIPPELLQGRENVVPDAVRAFAKGEFVLVMDDFDRENECDLVVLGETLTSAQMAFMIRHSTGIVCVVADKPRLEKFGLYPAVRDNTDKNATNFYVATDYLPTTTTGVSARDRTETVRAFTKDDARADDFSKPGHMFPLCPRPGGVLERGGHTESAYDMCRLAGKQTVSAIGELMRDDGEMMRLDECLAFSKTHKIPLITVEELRQWIRDHGTETVEMESTSTASTSQVPPPPKPFALGLSGAAGFKRDVSGSSVITATSVYARSTCTIPVRSHGFKKGMRMEMFQLDDGLAIEVVACIKGKVDGKEDVAVRIHSECFTGDVLRSAKCDCGLQLEKYFTVMEEEPAAVLLYIRGHEGRGIGLAAKMEAYRLQTEEHLDTVDSNLKLGFEADLRNYSGIAQVILKLGIKSVRLFSNNPDKLNAVKEYVPAKHAPLRTVALDGNRDYLRTKEERMDHFSTMEDEEDVSSYVEPLSEPKQPIEWPRFGDYAGFSIAIVHTAWNKECANRLVQGCESTLLAAKCTVNIIEVPGALDLVAGCGALIRKDNPPHAVVALGTYVRGDTDTSQMHYQATVNGLQELNVVSPMPIISGVVFCNTKEDAEKKCSADLGGSWAKNALQMISVTR